MACTLVIDAARVAWDDCACAGRLSVKCLAIVQAQAVGVPHAPAALSILGHPSSELAEAVSFANVGSSCRDIERTTRVRSVALDAFVRVCS